MMLIACAAVVGVVTAQAATYFDSAGNPTTTPPTTPPAPPQSVPQNMTVAGEPSQTGPYFDAAGYPTSISPTTVPPPSTAPQEFDAARPLSAKVKVGNNCAHNNRLKCPFPPFSLILSQNKVKPKTNERNQ